MVSVQSRILDVKGVVRSIDHLCSFFREDGKVMFKPPILVGSENSEHSELLGVVRPIKVGISRFWIISSNGCNGSHILGVVRHTKDQMLERP